LDEPSPIGDQECGVVGGRGSTRAAGGGAPDSRGRPAEGLSGLSADRRQAHHREVLAAQRHGELLEQLHRLKFGLEVLNRTTQQLSR
jgi:hypothetical protein